MKLRSFSCSIGTAAPGIAVALSPFATSEKWSMKRSVPGDMSVGKAGKFFDALPKNRNAVTIKSWIS